MRFHEQLRWGHHGGGTKAHPGPAKPEPVYYRSIIENPLSLTLLGETPEAWWGATNTYSRCLEFHTSFVGCVSTVCLRVSYA